MMLMLRQALIGGLLSVGLLGCTPAAETVEMNPGSQSQLESLRMTVSDVVSHQERGEYVVFLDSRNRMAWTAAEQKIPGAVRVADQAELEQVVTTLPREGLIITYCT